MEYPAEFKGASDEQIADLGVEQLITLTSTYDLGSSRAPSPATSCAACTRCSSATASSARSSPRSRSPYEPIRWRRDIPASGLVDKSTRVLGMIAAYRSRGHLMADTDPLMMNSDAKTSHPDLNVHTYGLTLWISTASSRSAVSTARSG